MFWQIPKHNAMTAVRWAPSLVKPCADSGSLCFAPAEGHLKHLDRIGTRSSDRSVNISDAEVLRHFRFESFDIELFVIGPVILSQAEKGVPIAGFLSAELSKPWAMWRQSHYVFGDLRAGCATIGPRLCVPMRPIFVHQFLVSSFPWLGMHISLCPPLLQRPWYAGNTLWSILK